MLNVSVILQPVTAYPPLRRGWFDWK